MVLGGEIVEKGGAYVIAGGHAGGIAEKQNGRKPVSRWMRSTRA
jgi:hypothetical protein